MRCSIFDVVLKTYVFRGMREKVDAYFQNGVSTTRDNALDQHLTYRLEVQYEKDTVLFKRTAVSIVQGP